jgi:hypothetical protein
MHALTEWLKATVRYNPSFPISALLLVAGIYRLLAPVAGTEDIYAASCAGTSVVVAYELMLAAIALLVLWPRRVVYETRVLLRIEGALRYAPAFTLLLLDPLRDLGTMLAIGIGTWVLMTVRAELAVRATKLAAAPWERRHAAALSLVGTVGIPLFVALLLGAGGYGRAIASFGGGVLALLVAPAFLFLDRGPAPEDRPFGTRVSAVVARLLDTTALSGLYLTALWLGHVQLDLAAYVPFVLLGALAVASATHVLGGRPFELATLVPGVVASGLVLLPPADLARNMSFPALLSAMLPLTCGLAWFFARKWPESLGPAGARIAYLATAIAPLRALPHGLLVPYGVALVSVVLGITLLRRLEKAFVAISAVTTLVAVVALPPVRDGFLPLVVGPVAGTALIVAAVFRFDPRGTAFRVGALLLLTSAGLGLVVRPPSALLVGPDELAVLLGGAALGLALVRARTRWHAATLALYVALLLAGPLWTPLSRVHDGVLLIGLAFLGLPIGVAIALRRERILASLE